VKEAFGEYKKMEGGMRRDRDAIHLSALLCEGINYISKHQGRRDFPSWFTYKTSISPIEPDRAHFLMDIST
jgi:hypothetical protein